MSLSIQPKKHRFPVSIISHAIWLYHRFNHSYRDVQEQLSYRGIIVSHETIRNWSMKCAARFSGVIRKRQRNPTVDSEGLELEVFLQKRRNKKAALRFLSRLLGSHLVPRVIVTDKLKSYNKPIKFMCPNTEHRSHKGLNNRVENAHQPTRRKEKSLIKFKSAKGVQVLLSLMGKVHNIVVIGVNRYKLSA